MIGMMGIAPEEAFESLRAGTCPDAQDPPSAPNGRERLEAAPLPQNAEPGASSPHEAQRIHSVRTTPRPTPWAATFPRGTRCTFEKAESSDNSPWP